jgi:hypothetical protein
VGRVSYVVGENDYAINSASDSLEMSFKEPKRYSAMNDIVANSFEDYLKARAQFSRSKFDLWLTEHGCQYEVDEKTYRGRRMEMRQCFANSSRLAIKDRSLTYCEGYISVHGIPIHHAWVIDKNDKVRDPTLKLDKTMPVREYFGVPFTVEYLTKVLLISDVYGLLDGYYNRKTIGDLIEGREKNWKGR